MARASSFPRTTTAAFLAFFLWVLMGSACGGHKEGEEIASRVPESSPRTSSWFACEDEPFLVDLGEPMTSLVLTDVGEQRDQVRDWIWTVAQAHHAHAAGLVLDELHWPIRPHPGDSGPRPPGGPTRSVQLESGELLVMLPTTDEEVMRDVLLRAYDDNALDNGFVDRVIAYRHGDLGVDDHVWMCRLPAIEGAWLGSSDTGLRMVRVNTEHELAGFLEGGVDLLSATCQAGELEVVGRARPSTNQAPITVGEVGEIVAATRQAVAWEEITAAFESGVDPTTLSPEHQRFMLQVLQRAESATNSVDEAQLRSETSGELGFSLDPVDDLERVVGNLRRIAQAIEKGTSHRDPSLVLFPLDQQYLTALDEMPRLSRRALAENLRSLANETVILGTQKIQEAFGQSGSVNEAILADFAGWALKLGAQQCARYDGNLRGTSTGMVLFYADLLMKLVTLGNAVGPADVPPRPALALSPSHCESLAVSIGRLWISPDPSRIRKTTQQIGFSSTITMINARQDILGKPVETDPSEGTQQFINRWNASWYSILTWEPQYEHNNQIHKWSAAAMHDQVRGCLGFVTVPAPGSLTLDQWVEGSPELKWRAIQEAGFYSTPSECMPSISSAPHAVCDRIGQISGGQTLLGRRGLTALETPHPKSRALLSEPPPYVTNQHPGRIHGLDSTKVTGKLDGGAAARPVGPDPTGFAKVLRSKGSTLEEAELWTSSKKAMTEIARPEDAREVVRTLSDVETQLTRAGQDAEHIRELKFAWEIRERQLIDIDARVVIPPGDFVSYVQPKGEAPRPGTPSVGKEWHSKLLRPELKVSERESKSDFKAGVSRGDAASGLRPAVRWRLGHSECDDDDGNDDDCK